MFIRVGYDIILNFPAPTTMILLLHILPSRASDLRSPDELHLEPSIPVTEFIDNFGNRCARISAPPGRLRICGDTIVEDTGLPVPTFENATQHLVENLPTETLQFLLPSRYCDVDRFNEVADKLFLHTEPGWPRVQAICDWVYNNVEFGYQYARATKTAFDVYEDRKGVCRDFTHLAITLCRCMNIPARYATGYLGDIGVPLSDSPMDFSACFQVYLGDRWHIFDARHNIRRIGWILQATGRDAADCAITTTFGPHTLEKFIVYADEVPSAELKDRRY
ncbi:MAG: transglutaminase family protein [Burkholderiaceae bacterium]|nr:transglutaminase family protein [Burkholderiaceae bacterium]